MNAAGFSTISGEAVIAALTIGLEHRLIAAAGEELVFDTPAGLLRARPALAPPLRSATTCPVSLVGVPSFVHSAGLPVDVGGRKITVDIAFGGEFYAIADSEAIGIPIEMGNASQLTRMGLDIKHAIESSGRVAHPLDSHLEGIQGTIFTGAPRVPADLRSATVLEGQVLRRSPGATGTAALLAVLDAMGLVMEGQTFTHEGVLGTTLAAKVLTRQLSGEVPMIVPAIEGSASITGLHEFVA
jgi:proline racemase